MHLLEWNKLIYNYNMEFSFWDKQKRSGKGWRIKCVEKNDFSMDTVKKLMVPDTSVITIFKERAHREVWVGNNHDD